jgi:hypothetical protein
MEFNKSELLVALANNVQSHLAFAQTLQNQSDEILNAKTSATSWSCLECLEHLNLYGNFYIPEIQKRMNATPNSSSDIFKSGRWGNKFALDMLPKEGMKKMKTFKSKNPIHSQLNASQVIATFIQQQHVFLELLAIAENKDLTKIKTSITLPLLKFRLGDTFRFVIYHNERHIVQAKRVLRNS